MNDMTLRYSIARDSEEIEENRVQRSTLRHKTMKHIESGMNPLSTLLSLIPRLLFGMKQALGSGRAVPKIEPIPEPIAAQAPRYIVRGEEISSAGLRIAG